MTVLFSRKCEYAIQGLLYLAEHRQGGAVPAEAIARDLGISRDFISKTLQGLVAEGLVASHRGKAGGFLLNRAPKAITLLEVVLIIDGSNLFENCVLGLPECGSDNACPVHGIWGPLREQIRSMLAATTLDQFQDVDTTLESLVQNAIHA